MATKKSTPASKSPAKKSNASYGKRKAANDKKPLEDKHITNTKSTDPVQIFSQAFTSKRTENPNSLKLVDLEQRLIEYDIEFPPDLKKFLNAVNKINPDDFISNRKIPEDVRKSLESLKQKAKRFHGAKLYLTWFPFPMVGTPCSEKFGYMSTPLIRNATRLPFDTDSQLVLGELGNLMGEPLRDIAPDSIIPAGFTYFGQFVDHDVTLDISSSIEVFTDANTINNMRSPALDLDSVYAGGPGLRPFMYVFPGSGPDSAIKFQLGTNTLDGTGGPGGPSGIGGMIQQTDFDLPRTCNPLNPALSPNTAIIGDPRNDENLIVSQFHHAMLVFHNKVVEMLVIAGVSGDIFTAAKRIVIHHYQWAVVHDYLKRICGEPAVSDALTNVNAPINSPFRMPVEFAVAAYRFGHSMIRNQYWLNFNFPSASLAEVFQFNRNPELPLHSMRVVDFNAFFDTGIVVPINNKAKKIDSGLSNGLESIPGESGIFAILASRNLRRALCLGLPSGQGMAQMFSMTPMSEAQLKQGLPLDEVNILDSHSKLLLRKTPLWYYVLRESMVLQNGDQLGPVGAKIVADTFVRMLKRDGNSFLHVAGGFTPFLPSDTSGDFTVADLIKFSGVHLP